MSEQKAKKDKGANPLDYQPSETELAMLELLLDPYKRLSTVTSICKEIGISRSRYYAIHQKPDFAAYYRAVCQEAVRIKSGQLVNIGIREAQKGGTAGYQYWRDLMKLGGMIEDEKKDITLTGDVTLRFVDPREAADDDE